LPPWSTLLTVIIGLVIGTDVGARLANAVSPARLRVLLIGFVSVMALYMTVEAIR